MSGIPRFDTEALLRISRLVRHLVCECPTHLVQLVMDPRSFERYSAQCANRNPANEALHRQLQRDSTRARAIIERALARVARAEGIAIPARRLPRQMQQ